jgi:hypothetical protein
VHLLSLAPPALPNTSAFASFALTLFVVLAGAAWQLDPRERA